ncbi:hypothetical protein [Paenibacillus agricola]|uniref:hypothetical protein n=1 Tax=Paenibacillus agricola TaxID=2716264 RepID=UPI001A9D4B1D|nr:hypothetical protein [Paenibacillus agricola]
MPYTNDRLLTRGCGASLGAPQGTSRSKTISGRLQDHTTWVKVSTLSYPARNRRELYSPTPQHT